MTKKSVVQPFALIHGRIILVDKIETHKAIVVADGRIADLVDSNGLDVHLPTVDVEGRLIAPGLIDIHTHGAMGYSFNDPTVEAYTTIARQQVRHGVTGLLATIATAPVPRLVECLSFARQRLLATSDGAQILGVHLEGPYFSPAQRGAQDPASIRTPDDGTLDRLLEFYDVIRIMAFAPELPGALVLTERLTSLGIVPAAGHSSARERDMVVAIQAGLRHIIHIWSGQSSTVRDGPWRVPGLLEVSLGYDNLTVEMIADNRHLPPTLMKLAYKCIGPERLCVVSDATSGAGLEDGTHFRMGDMEYVVQDGVGMMLDRTAFGGSTTFLNQMVPILVGVVEIPLVEAIRMVALNPARVLGIASRKGSLEPDKDADITIFNDDFTPWRVLIGGRWAYAS
jgi:N-acetylglucosamine-6-phosphate deacetylase